MRGEGGRSCQPAQARREAGPECRGAPGAWVSVGEIRLTGAGLFPAARPPMRRPGTGPTRRRPASWRSSLMRELNSTPGAVSCW